MTTYTTNPTMSPPMNPTGSPPGNPPTNLAASPGWKIFFSPLVQRLVLVTTLPVVGGLALLAILMLFQYEQIIRNTIEQRYILSAEEIKTRSERWLKTGLPLQNIPNMQGILSSIDQQIQDEFAVDIIDNRGVVTYSLDPSRLQDAVRASLIRDINIFVEEQYDEFSGQGEKRGEGQNFIYNENNRRFIVAPMLDNIGNWTAAVIVSFPQSSYADIVDKSTYQIFYYFSVIGIIIAIIALLIGSVILKKPVQLLSELERQFARLSHDKQIYKTKDLTPLEKILTANLRKMDNKMTEIQNIDSQTSATANKI